MGKEKVFSLGNKSRLDWKPGQQRSLEKTRPSVKKKIVALQSAQARETSGKVGGEFLGPGREQQE